MKEDEKGQLNMRKETGREETTGREGKYEMMRKGSRRREQTKEEKVWKGGEEREHKKTWKEGETKRGRKREEGGKEGRLAGDQEQERLGVERGEGRTLHRN